MNHIMQSTFSTLSFSDAVHGPIDIAQSISADRLPALREILKSKAIRRLASIKLLGYAADRYVSANHSRYAHALGTLHVAREFCSKLSSDLNWFEREEKTCSLIGNAFRLSDETAIIDHILLSGLLQDMGELPYGLATKGLYVPSPNMRKDIQDDFEIDLIGLRSKEVFTLSLLNRILSDLSQTDRAKISRYFLTYLITGAKPRAITVPDCARSLRYIIDGEVDADRLDYVFRDAHHAIGSKGTPSGVIHTICDLDGQGLVFNDAGPVSEFLQLRGHLWSYVYLAPSTRFRSILLRTILVDHLGGPEGAFPKPKPLSVDALLQFDDQYIDDILDSYVHEIKNAKGNRAREAVQILSGHGSEYEQIWLPEAQFDGRQDDSSIPIPTCIYWDTYSDYKAFRGHSLFKPGTVRICNSRFEHLSGASTVPLEQCSGGFISSGRSSVPITGVEVESGIMLHVPVNENEFKTKLRELAVRAEVYRQIEIMDKSEWLSNDTTNRKEFSAPSIFISYRRTDKAWVEMVSSILADSRHRYRYISQWYDDATMSFVENSREAVGSVEAVMVLLSKEYCDRCRESPSGPLAEEWRLTKERWKHQEIEVVLLRIDESTLDDLDDEKFENRSFPDLGPALSGCSEHERLSAILAVLERLKEKWKAKSGQGRRSHAGRESVRLG